MKEQMHTEDWRFCPETDCIVAKPEQCEGRDIVCMAPDMEGSLELWPQRRVLIAAAPGLLTALNAAKGYMLNAAIDLETGTKKATTLATLNGGIKAIDAAIAKAKATGG